MTNDAASAFLERWPRQKEFGGLEKAVNNRTPLVSVLVFAYQHGPFIRQCLDGILAQETDFEFEIIIGEDASTDGTREICREYAERHPDRIRLFLRDRAESVFHATPDSVAYFNIFWCYLAARGKYIALCEGDDFWTHPGKLSAQVSFLERHNDYNLCFHEAAVLYEEQGKWVTKHRRSDFPWCEIDRSRATHTTEDLLRSPLCATCSCLYRKPEKWHFPAWVLLCVSGDMALSAVHCEGAKVHFMPEIWGAYRKHRQGITATHTGDRIHHGRIMMYLGLAQELGPNYFEVISDRVAHHLAHVISSPPPSDRNQWDGLLATVSTQASDLDSDTPGFSAWQIVLQRLRDCYRSGAPPLKPIKHRVLVAANYPKSPSAPNIWLGRILPLWRASGISPEVIFFSSDGASGFFSDWLRAQGVPCHLRRFSTTEQNVRDIVTLAEQIGTGVFIPNVTVAGYYATPWLHERNISSVAVIRSDDVFYHEIIASFIAGEERFCVDGAVAVSAQLAETIRATGPKAFPVLTNPSGAPVPTHPAQPPTGTFRLVYAGRMVEEQKAIPQTVESLLQYLPQHPEVEVTFLGDGPEREPAIEKAKQAGLEKQMHFPGGISPLKIQEVMAQHHAFFLLSEYEGLSTALVEAMGCGLPPIVMDMRSGLSEIIQNGVNGIVVTNRNASFHDAIESLRMDRTIWQRMASAARATIEERFSSRLCGERWIDFLTTLPGRVDGAVLMPLKQATRDLPTFGTHARGIQREDFSREGKNQRAPHFSESISKTRLLQVRSQIGNYSETFLDDHARFLSSATTTLYGFPLPHQVPGRGPGTILQPQDIAAIQEGSNDEAKIEAYTTGLARWLKSENPEVVLAETSLMGARVWRACERTGIPMVIHFHGADAFVRDLISQLKEEWAPMFETAAALVVVSRAMEAQLLRLGAPHEKVLLLPYGVDTHLTSLADPANAPPTFLAVGRFVPKKAPHHTIRALRHLLEGKPDARLIMAGDGPMLEPCKQLAKEIGCDHAVEFRGAISREEVSRLMTEVRGFVQHSVIAENGDSEGLPLAILEAGAHGLPVVATRHAGIPDALRDNVDGVLVAEGDEKAMAQGMFRLLHHPETAERMGSSLRQRVCEKYDREGSMERLRGLLEGVTAARKPKPVEMALQNAQAAQVPHERLEALRHVIGLDRGIQTAYMAYAQCALETSQSRPALFALREADRLQPLPETMTAQFRQLENIDPLLRSDIETYNLRSGKVPLPPATKPRRILVFTNLLPPQELGGYGRTVWEFCDLLMQRGHEVRILTADVPAFAKPPDPSYERVEKYVSRALQLFGSWDNGCAEPIDDIDEIKRRTLHNHRLILETAKAFQPDWCMAGNLDFVGSAILGDLLKNGWPVLHRLGNVDPGYLPEKTPKTPRYTIAGCSAWLEKGLRERGYSLPRFDILHPGSPLEYYYKYFLPDPTPLRLCFAGLVMPYKGTQVLLEALALLQKKNIPFTCEIAGSSTDPEHYDGLRQRAAAAGLYPQIQFTGFQSKAQLRALYARSNVLVFPSVFEEPFGKSQTEAMAAGLVVVTSGTGGASEIVEDDITGLHFTPGSAEDLAAKLESLAQDPTLARRLQAAGQERAFRFTTLASVERIETIAEELIATPRNQKVLV